MHVFKELETSPDVQVTDCMHTSVHLHSIVDIFVSFFFFFFLGGIPSYTRE